MTHNIDPGLFRGCPQIANDSEQNTNLNPTSCCKLHVSNWLADVPYPSEGNDLVEIRFKNTRKGFYRNVNALNLEVGEMVAVEAFPGHDIGMVSLVGPLVNSQMRRYGAGNGGTEYRKIYRKAKPTDIEKWKDAIGLEHKTMIRSRQLAIDLKLDMKIGDVEYQGDKTKAIFYYIADERVDFRELIKVLAEEFRIRVEMRQIGARQEAGRIGGIGSCGRELCCSTWMSSFVSVTTTVARQQELSLNPQKLAGQCGKLKCCLNYEVAAYRDARKSIPSSNIALETEEGKAFHQKTDIFKGIMWYTFDPVHAANLIPVGVDRVREIIQLNKAGKVVERLVDKIVEDTTDMGYLNPVGQESLTRFDQKKKKRGDFRKRNRKGRGQQKSK
ncbi:MAG: hypothetical protein J7L96_01420 [Bacteroidales bacterium]|nr:hypothetical protein [Bacteroidales bacterium]